MVCKKHDRGCWIDWVLSHRGSQIRSWTVIIGKLVTFCNFCDLARANVPGHCWLRAGKELRERNEMLLSMGWRECDRLPPHPQADHRGTQRGWECQAKTNGTPRGGPAPGLSNSTNLCCSGLTTFTTLTVILGRGTLPYRGQESKAGRYDAKEDLGHKQRWWNSKKFKMTSQKSLKCY